MDGLQVPVSLALTSWEPCLGGLGSGSAAFVYRARSAPAWNTGRLPAFQE